MRHAATAITEGIAIANHVGIHQSYTNPTRAYSSPEGELIWQPCATYFSNLSAREYQSEPPNTLLSSLSAAGTIRALRSLRWERTSSNSPKGGGNSGSTSRTSQTWSN